MPEAEHHNVRIRLRILRPTNPAQRAFRSECIDPKEVA